MTPRVWGGGSWVVGLGLSCQVVAVTPSGKRAYKVGVDAAFVTQIE